MAERLSDEDEALFRAHIRKFYEQDACPICHKRDWYIAGLEQALGYQRGEQSLTAPAMPIVQVMCTTCFYVRQFAWVPIQRWSNRDG